MSARWAQESFDAPCKSEGKVDLHFGAPAEKDTGWVPDEAELAVIDVILDPLAGRSFSSMAEIEVDFREFLLDDLREIDKNDVHGPVKVATDVLRNLRDHFRFAAEYPDFTPESHAVFVGRL